MVQRLNILCYYKELVAVAAQESGLAQEEALPKVMTLQTLEKSRLGGIKELIER